MLTVVQEEAMTAAVSRHILIDSEEVAVHSISSSVKPVTYDAVNLYSQMYSTGRLSVKPDCCG